MRGHMRRPDISPGWRLGLHAFLVLFVELALIRWLGSNVVYLSFFSNLVLLGSFLGIGVGFLRARHPHALFPYAPILLGLLVLFVARFPVQIDRGGSELIFFGSFSATGLPTWVTLPLVFLAVAAVMAMLADGLARQFVRFEPLEAYRLDIAGSIAGIIGFSALSFLGAPPAAWGVVAGLLIILLMPPANRWVVVIGVLAILGTVGLLGRESLRPGYSWSPYYRVQVSPGGSGAGSYRIDVNGIPHQSITSVAVVETLEALYDRPYDRIADGDPGRVLIIGAGTGTDVALALARGATSVDAVEIDPRLLQVGRDLHPDRPYADPRVTAHVNDGRAFLEQTDATYDLVLFALPDSLTLVSGQSSVRLESYLFTQEAIESARAHLVPGGVFAMYNYYREDWLIDRLATTLERVFGTAPCLDTVGERGRQAALVVSTDPAAIACDGVWAGTPLEPSHDDYPFLYLRERGIPGFYLVTIGLILVGSVLLVRLAGARYRPMAAYSDLFLMGAAFLLLETKSVVQFALLFGTTWFVNSLVFIGVLLSVYVAIEVVRRVTLPSPAILFGWLVVSVLVALAIPLSALLALPLPLRFAAAVLLWFTPIFIANLVFARRFRDVGESNVAFGANLLGSVAGGVLEYAALVTGYGLLAILVAVLYVAAFFAWRGMDPRGAERG